MPNGGAARLCRMAVFLWILTVFGVAAHAEEDTNSSSSNSANNPVEPRLTVQYWNYYAPSVSEVNGGAESGVGRVLLPFTIAGIQQIFHIDPPVVTNPTASSGPRIISPLVSLTSVCRRR
jgi:hypothetical protein